MTRKAAVNRMIHWQTAAIGRKVSPDSLVRYDGSRTLPAQSFRGRNDRIITAKLWKPLCRFNGKITSTSFFFIKFSIIFFHLSFDSKAVREKRKNLISLRFSRKRIEGFVSTRKITIDKSLDKERRWKKRWLEGPHTRAFEWNSLERAVQSYWTRSLSTDSVELTGRHGTIMRTRSIFVKLESLTAQARFIFWSSLFPVIRLSRLAKEKTLRSLASLSFSLSFAQLEYYRIFVGRNSKLIQANLRGKFC